MDSYECILELKELITLKIFLNLESSVNKLEFNSLEPTKYEQRLDKLEFNILSILEESKLGNSQIQKAIDSLVIPPVHDYSKLKALEERIDFGEGIRPVFLPLNIEYIDRVMIKYKRFCNVVKNLKTVNENSKQMNLFTDSFSYLNDSAHQSRQLLLDTVDLLKKYIPGITSRQFVDILNNKHVNLEWDGSKNALKYLLNSNDLIRSKLTKNYGKVLTSMIKHKGRPFKLPTNNNYINYTSKTDMGALDTITENIVEIIEKYKH